MAIFFIIIINRVT